MTDRTDWLIVALPKGRLADETAELFKHAGLFPPDLNDLGRRLVMDDEERGIRYVWLRPVDALTYVQHGVAALGVIGKDVLAEHGAVVDELLDLGIGRCRISLAAPAEFLEKPRPNDRPLRVATHLPRLTAAYFEQQQQPVEIISLRGSVEIAPKLGLADVVVDIVQTGSTLKANGLVEFKKLYDITSRLVTHPGARRSGDPRYALVTEALFAAVNKKTQEVRADGR